VSIDVTASSRGAGNEPARLLAELKRIAVEQLATVPGGLYEPIERKLSEAIRLGTSLSSRQDLKTVLAMRQRNASYVMRYRELVARAFDDFAGSAPSAGAGLPLDLVGESELGFQLAGQRLGEAISRRYQRPLELLERRFEALARALGTQGGTNPVGASQLAAVFLRTFADVAATETLQPLLFRHYEDELGKVLGDLYQRMNSRLALNGYSADPVRPSAAEAQAPGRLGPPAAVASAPVPPPSCDATACRLDELRDLLRIRRLGRASPGCETPPVAGGTGQARHMRATELASVASLLQCERQPDLESALEAGGDLPSALRARLLDGARRLGIDPDQVPLGAEEEDAVDLVGLVFQAMVEAHSLASEGRRLFARLALPYVKLALGDRRLFSDAAHPARRFADTLALSCEEYDPESPHSDALARSAAAAVERVVASYNEDLAVFELATSELRDLVEQRRSRAEIVERRSVETVHGRERLLQARLQAAAALAQRASGQSISPTVSDFLEQYWSHHLAQVLLRDGAGGERHAQALALADELVAIDQAAARCARGEVVRRVVAIRVSLVECLSSAGLDADAANEWMAGLARTLAFPDAERVARHYPAMPRLADDSDDTRLLQLVGGTASIEYDHGLADRIRALEPGTWLRVVDEAGDEVAVKLAWVSPLTSRLLLVNRRGVRMLVASPEQLAALSSHGRLLLEDDHLPFDEALRQVRHRLSQDTADAAVAA
jgi:hypothetical protein